MFDSDEILNAGYQPIIMVFLKTINVPLMAFLDIIYPTIYGILDTMIRSYTKIWPSVDGTINDVKYGF